MISVVTITHNRKDLLAKAIRSVLDQSHSDFEHIIIDDGSTEDILSLLKNFNDPRLIYFRTKRLGHIPSLRNLGIEQSRGSIIAFLDNDDLWSPDYLKTLTEYYSDKTTLSVISNAWIDKGSQRVSALAGIKPSKIQESLLEQKLSNDKFVIYTSCFSFRSLQFRLNKNMKYGDNDFILRILSAGPSKVIPEEMVTIKKHEHNMSAPQNWGDLPVESYLEELQTLRDLLQAKKISPALFRKSYSSVQYKLADMYAKQNKKRKARTNFINSFLIYPLNWKGLARTVLPKGA